MPYGWFLVGVLLWEMIANVLKDKTFWLILMVGGLFLYTILKPTDNGFSEREVEYQIQIHDLQQERDELKKEYNVLENSINRLEHKLVEDSAFVADATNSDVDSLFSAYLNRRR